MKLKRQKKGFTIVELVIVVAVIAVLSAILIPTFVGLVNKAHIAADDSLVRDLNNALAIDREVNGEHKTMSDALKITDEYGFNVQRINAKANKSEILWDSENDVFCYFDGQTEKITYIPEVKLKTPADDVEDWQYFVIKRGVASSSDLSDKYSTYLYQSTATTLTTTKGLDVGEETSVTSVTYNGGTSARDIVIRTNSITTSLTINGYVDSSNNTLGDVVYHYGVAGTLNVIKCATGSYHENGKVGFAEIKTGRIVLESKSEVEHIHINSNGSNAFDEVVIKDNGTQKTPETITRDAVEVSSATLVVTVESVSGAQEEVYVYASGTSGTTEKTTTQNKDVNSTLGKLVLDNGTTSKALNENEKEEAKDEVSSEAVSAKFEAQEGNGDYVARIGQTGYMSLQSAVEAAVDGNTIHLLKDVSFTSNDYLLINKDITLNLSDKSITGAHDPMIVIGASVGSYQPNSSQLTHTGHLTIKGEGSITSSNWDMICIFPDAVLDIYGGNYTGFKAAFYIYGGTLNTYAGNFTATSPSNTYIVQVKGAGTANIYAGNFTTPVNGGYGVYLDNASVSNFGSTNGEGPTFNTWRPCIASNGSESHAVLANIYSGTYHSYRSDNATGENSVIQLANNTSETQTLNVYGGTFEQTGSNENRCIFNVRYGGTINVNISGGNFVATSSSRLFNGVGSSTWPSNNNVHVTVQNNAISKTQNVKVYNTKDVYQSARDFDLVIE